MNKPHWQKLHDASINDVRFWLEQIWEFKLLLRKHPSDAIGDSFRFTIKELRSYLSLQIKVYEKIYGDKPDVAQLKKEVEYEQKRPVY